MRVKLSLLQQWECWKPLRCYKIYNWYKYFPLDSCYPLLQHSLWRSSWESWVYSFLIVVAEKKIFSCNKLLDQNFRMDALQAPAADWTWNNKTSRFWEKVGVITIYNKISWLAQINCFFAKNKETYKSRTWEKWCIDWNLFVMNYLTLSMGWKVTRFVLARQAW